jgi:L,D-transpeptidase ErfK/SrfK
MSSAPPGPPAWIALLLAALLHAAAPIDPAAAAAATGADCPCPPSAQRPPACSAAAACATDTATATKTASATATDTPTGTGTDPATGRDRGMQGGRATHANRAMGSGATAADAQPSAADGVVVPLDPAGAPATSDALAPPTPAEAPPLQLVLDRRRRLLRVVVDGRTLRRYPVAVGRPGWETPVGQFSVLEKQVQPVWEHPVSGLRIGPGPANPLGSRWIGFQRDCRGRRGFQGARPVVLRGCIVAGFHGTPNRASIGRASSHGCVRLYEEDVRELFELVRIGTPVMVLP